MRKLKAWIICVGIGGKKLGINSDRLIMKCSQIWNELSWIKCNRINSNQLIRKCSQIWNELP